MDRDPRHRRVARAATHALAAIAAACWSGAGQAADAPEQRRVEVLRFADMPVRVVRGASPGETLPARREIVSFANGTARPVTVVRGTGAPVAAVPLPTTSLPAPQQTIERIAFAGAAPASVTVVRGRGAAGAPYPAAPFPPASAPEFERIAHAVHGAESSHGADPAMWRPDPDGPQGPMQVSKAAARDSGGGNRFDPGQNLLLGRVYLARMFGRYRNWPDALAAYNWGPGNVDRWIAAGRDAGRMPLETTHYIDRVLRDARRAGMAAGGRLPVTR
ncbi:MAG: lytic transglycosylase domain-containing protein [Alphaproteobacteria bacterium]